jgi:hypothetical protein
MTVRFRLARSREDPPLVDHDRGVRVDGARLYTLVTQKSAADGRLDLDFTPGLAAYAFMFG